MRGVSLSARDRRTVAIGIGSVSVLLMLSRGVPMMRDWHSQSDARRAALRQRLEFVRQSRAQFAQIRDTLEGRRMRLAALNATVPHSPNTTAASAALAAIVE